MRNDNLNTWTKDELIHFLVKMQKVSAQRQKLQKVADTYISNQYDEFNKNIRSMQHWLIVSVVLVVIWLLGGIFVENNIPTYLLILVAVLIVALGIIGASWKYNVICKIRQNLPEAYRVSADARIELDKLESQYKDDFALVPCAYNNPSALRRIKKLLSSGQANSFNEAADLYDRMRHNEIVDHWRDERIDQEARKAREEELANRLRTIDLINAMTIEREQRVKMEAAQSYNARLRNSIASHGADPSTI